MSRKILCCNIQTRTRTDLRLTQVMWFGLIVVATILDYGTNTSTDWSSTTVVHVAGFSISSSSYSRRCSRSPSSPCLAQSSQRQQQQKQQQEQQQSHHSAPCFRVPTTAPFQLQASSSSAQTTKEEKNWVSLQQATLQQQQSLTYTILRQDPLVYSVPNFLSPQECARLVDYAKSLERSNEEEDDGVATDGSYGVGKGEGAAETATVTASVTTTTIKRKMTRSNPPEVLLDASKLWPLPFLSLLAGLPPVLRVWTTEQSHNPFEQNLLIVALPNIISALIVSFGLAFGVILPLLRFVASKQARTSVAVALNCVEDFDVIAPLVTRISSLTSHPWQNWEAPVVTRYDPGAVFQRHNDASPTRGSEWMQLGGQRVVTCICYLNTIHDDDIDDGDDYVGGSTYFDQLEIAVQPLQGQALFFFPADSLTWQADGRTTHESLPCPPNQSKWIVQMFGRAQRVPPPLGLPDEFKQQQEKHQTIFS